MGLQAVNAITFDAFVAFYCGAKRSTSDGVGPMDTYPSRYGVSVRSKKQGGKFSIDAFAGRKLSVQWLNKHQTTGACMNVTNIQTRGWHMKCKAQILGFSLELIFSL